jgi:hypothetical protein
MHPTHNTPTPDTAQPVDITPADVLRGAACYLDLHGWRQGALYTDDRHTTDTPSITPAACALGAIGMAAFGERIPDNPDHRPEWRDYKRATNALDDYLALTGAKNSVPVTDDDSTDSASVGDWNDAPGRTAAEVIAALNAAADDYERTHTAHLEPAGPCWSGFCIASFCDGIHHVDATGYAWTEARPMPGVDQ